MNNISNQSSRSLSNVDDGPLRIHVGNIPFSWSDKHLREQFGVNNFEGEVVFSIELEFFFVVLDFRSS